MNEKPHTDDDLMRAWNLPRALSAESLADLDGAEMFLASLESVLISALERSGAFSALESSDAWFSLDSSEALSGLDSSGPFSALQNSGVPSQPSAYSAIEGGDDYAEQGLCLEKNGHVGANQRFDHEAAGNYSLATNSSAGNDLSFGSLDHSLDPPELRGTLLSAEWATEEGYWNTFSLVSLENFSECSLEPPILDQNESEPPVGVNGMVALSPKFHRSKTQSTKAETQSIRKTENSTMSMEDKLFWGWFLGLEPETAKAFEFPNANDLIDNSGKEKDLSISSHEAQLDKSSSLYQSAIPTTSGSSTKAIPGPSHSHRDILLENFTYPSKTSSLSAHKKKSSEFKSPLERSVFAPITPRTHLSSEYSRSISSLPLQVSSAPPNISTGPVSNLRASLSFPSYSKKPIFNSEQYARPSDTKAQSRRTIPKRFVSSGIVDVLPSAIQCLNVILDYKGYQGEIQRIILNNNITNIAFSQHDGRKHQKLCLQPIYEYFDPGLNMELVGFPQDAPGNKISAVSGILQRKVYIRNISMVLNTVSLILYVELSKFNINLPYEPQIHRYELDSRGAVVNETKCGLCPFCPAIKFLPFKNSSYLSHLTLEHGVYANNFVVPEGLYYGKYVVTRNVDVHKTRTVKAIQCPACFQVVEVSCWKNKTNPLLSYFRHFKKKHQNLTKTFMRSTVDVVHCDE